MRAVRIGLMVVLALLVLAAVAYLILAVVLDYNPLVAHSCPGEGACPAPPRRLWLPW